MHALALALLLSVPPKAPPVEAPPKAPAVQSAHELAYQRALAGERVYVSEHPGRPKGRYVMWLEDGQVWHSRVEEAKRAVPFSVRLTEPAIFARRAASGSLPKPGAVRSLEAIFMPTATTFGGTSIRACRS